MHDYLFIYGDADGHNPWASVHRTVTAADMEKAALMALRNSRHTEGKTFYLLGRMGYTNQRLVKFTIYEHKNRCECCGQERQLPEYSGGSTFPVGTNAEDWYYVTYHEWQSGAVRKVTKQSAGI